MIRDAPRLIGRHVARSLEHQAQRLVNFMLGHGYILEPCRRKWVTPIEIPICPLRLLHISHRTTPPMEPLFAPGYSPLIYRDALGFSSTFRVFGISSLAARDSSSGTLSADLGMLELLCPHGAKVAGQEGPPYVHRVHRGLRISHEVLKLSEGEGGDRGRVLDRQRKLALPYWKARGPHMNRKAEVLFEAH